MIDFIIRMNKRIIKNTPKNCAYMPMTVPIKNGKIDKPALHKRINCLNSMIHSGL